MNRSTAQFLLIVTFFVGPSIGSLLAADHAAAPEKKQWTENFSLSSCQWAAAGSNDYFILEPGYRQLFEGHEGNDELRLTITVLNETKTIGDVETRIVEERESRNGQLVEVSRNYFAVCRPTNDIFYFGEDVDMYKNGKVSSHDGSWSAGKEGVRAGLFMPARTLLGARYCQEIAPGVALDRVEIASDSISLTTPAGTFHDCLKTEETTPLEPGAKDYKTFARGVGLVQDGAFLLTKYEHLAEARP